MDLEAVKRQGKEKQNHSVAQQPGKSSTNPSLFPHPSNTGNVAQVQVGNTGKTMQASTWEALQHQQGKQTLPLLSLAAIKGCAQLQCSSLPGEESLSLALRRTAAHSVFSSRYLEQTNLYPWLKALQPLAAFFWQLGPLAPYSLVKLQNVLYICINKKQESLVNWRTDAILRKKILKLPKLNRWYVTREKLTKEEQEGVTTQTHVRK